MHVCAPPDFTHPCKPIYISSGTVPSHSIRKHLTGWSRRQQRKALLAGGMGEGGGEGADGGDGKGGDGGTGGAGGVGGKGGEGVEGVVANGGAKGGDGEDGEEVASVASVVSIDVLWLEGIGHAGFLLHPPSQEIVLDQIVAY